MPNAPGNPNVSTTQHSRVHANGIFGATSGVVVKQISGHITEMLVDPSTKSTTLPATVINSMQSTQKSGGKNKKNKKKTAPSEKHSTKQPNPKQKATAPTNEEKNKPTRYPCKLYVEDHVTWHYLRLQECTEYLAKMDTGKIPAFLRNPFPA